MVLSFRFLASLESASSLEVGGDASPFAEPSPGIWRRCSSIGVSSGVLNPLLAPPPRVVSCARRIVTDARSAGASASASASPASWSASTAFGEAAAAAAATAAASACWHSCTTFEGTNMAPRAERAGDAECVTAGGDGAARNERWRACCTCTEVVVVVVVASPSGEAVEAAALDEAVEASSTSAGGCATTTAVPCTGSRSATSSTLTAASGRLRLLGRACSVSMTFGSVALHFLPVRSTSLIVSPKVLAMSSVRPASLASLISVTLCRDSARRPTAPPEGEAGDERAGTAWNMSATCLVRDSRSCDSLSDSSFDGAAAAGSSVGIGDGDESEGLLSGERGTIGEVAGDCLCVDGDADGELVVGDVGDAAVAVAAAAAASAVEVVVGPDAARASNGELAFLRSIEGDEATSRIVGDADVLVLVFVGSALAVAAAAAADLLLLIPLPLREDELDVDADGVLPLLLVLDESFEDDLSFLCRDDEDDSLSLELESDDDEPPVVPERFLRSLSFGLLVDEGSLDSFESLERDGDGLEADDDDDDEIESAELLPPLLLSVRLRLRSLLLLLLPLESFSSLSLSFLCLEDFLWRRGASLEAPPSPLAVAAAAAASSVPVAVAMRRSSSDMASESASRSHCHRLSHSHSLSLSLRNESAHEQSRVSRTAHNHANESAIERE